MTRQRKARPSAWVRQSRHNAGKPRSRWRWEVVYEDPGDGYRRRTKGGFITKQDADDWRTEFLTDVKKGEWVDPSRPTPTLQVVAREWLTGHTTRKALTREGYRTMIESEDSRLATFAATPVSEVTYAAIRRWVGELNKALAATTVRNYFYVLRSVLDHAVDAGMIPSNPALRIKKLPSVAKGHTREQDRYPLSTADVDRIVAALPEPWDMYTRLVGWTGMRPEEAAALRLSDLDLNNGLVSVRSVLVSVNGVLTREDMAKTSKSRRAISLDNTTTAHLREYAREHTQRAMDWFTRADAPFPGEDLPLFAGTKVGRANGKPDIERLDFSKPMRHGSFYNRHWKPALTKAGLPETIVFYDLRHAHVSWLVAGGQLGIKEISERVGHSSAVMTLDRYAHVPSDAHDRQRSALDALTPTPSNVTPIKRAR